MSTSGCHVLVCVCVCVCPLETVVARGVIMNNVHMHKYYCGIISSELPVCVWGDKVTGTGTHEMR